jgi:hypothetical protein
VKKIKDTFVYDSRFNPGFPYISSALVSGVTVAAERERLGSTATGPKGDTCHCCGARTKVYERPFGVGQAMALYRLVRLYMKKQRPYTYKEIKYNGRDYTFLTGFHLIMREPSENRLGLVASKKGTAGRYFPTRQGIAFVHGKLLLPAKIREFRGQIIAASVRQTTFLDIARERPKDYDDLMSPTKR